MPLALDLDIPPAYEERIVCAISAAVEYNIPADIMLAIAEVEGGRAGIKVKNRSNGSYDIGSMQINTNYLSDLASYGITPDDANLPGCYPFKLAAWRIRGHILKDRGDIWTRASNYHSRTPVHNSRYRGKIIRSAQKWAGWLQSKFKTHFYERSS